MLKKYFIFIFMILSFARPALSLDIMRADELKPGMTGTGYSVFKGSTPEPFKAHIIGVIKNWKSQQDMILAELEGVNLEFTGIVAGMSGSPVYVDNKLIGAVAYAWSFSKKPIAGITPIEDMMKLWKEPVDNNTQLDSSSPPDENPVYVDTREYGQIEIRRISTPLMTAGLGDTSLAYLSEHLAKYGLVPTQGGTTSKAQYSEDVDKLGPGHVISCPLITGDIESSAIGTVTAREGDLLLAFGHPFFNTGKSSIPMAGGSIATVMPLQTASFKIGSAGRRMGAIFRDGDSAIAGKIGAAAPMFPMKVTVDDPEYDVHQELNVEIAQIEDLSPYLVISVLGQAVSNASGDSGAVSVRYSMDGKFENLDRPFHFEDMYFSSFGFFGAYTSKYILELLMNGEKRVRLESLDVKIKIIHGQQTARISGFTLDKNKIRPGEKVTAGVKLIAFDKSEKNLPVSFVVPKDLRPGLYKLFIEGSDATSGRPSMANINNFDQLFDILGKWIPENALVLRLVYPEQSIGLEGSELQGLPPSLFNTMLLDQNQNMNLFDRYDRAVFLTDMVISGGYVTNLTIEKEF